MFCKIVFEATRGGSVRSDIAIDDIMLDSGPCPGEHLTMDHIELRDLQQMPHRLILLPAEMEVRARVGSSNEIE